MKVLPELLKSVEFGGGGPKAFAVVMKIATNMSSDDFDTKVTPVVIRLFGNPDRALRVCLLDSLPLMIDRLSQKLVNDKIFPQIVSSVSFRGHRRSADIARGKTSGFTDAAPVVREQTLKSVLTLITKLSDRTINGELLRYLAKTANDEQPGIRTNTTICLGKIAKNLGASSRSKVLLAAFQRSLRDPFVHARNAALLALAVTGDFFSEDECASRVMPAICPLLIDKEKLVRDQAHKTLDIYIQKMRKAAAGMPDTALPPQTSADSGPRMSTPQPTEASAAGGSSWAGWAISSFTNKLSAAAGEIQPSTIPSNGSTTSLPGSLASPVRPDPGKRPVVAPSSSATLLHRQALKSPLSAPSSRSPSANQMGGDSIFTPEASVAGDDDDDVDAWRDMDDHGGDSGDYWNDSLVSQDPQLQSTLSVFSTAEQGASRTAASRAFSSSSATVTGNGSATPFGGDDDEPDFEGWLAAQTQKKNAAKGLPKGLSKSAGGVGAKKSTASTVLGKPKTVPAKKVSPTPKETEEDDGWGDGW